MGVDLGGGGGGVADGGEAVEDGSEGGAVGAVAVVDGDDEDATVGAGVDEVQLHRRAPAVDGVLGGRMPVERREFVGAPVEAEFSDAWRGGNDDLEDGAGPPVEGVAPVDDEFGGDSDGGGRVAEGRAAAGRRG